MTLYLLTNQITGLRYVGATKLTLPVRMDAHRRDALIKLRTTEMCKAIRIYGWNSFDLSILATTHDHDELMRMEQATIAALGTIFPAGYNMAHGGVGVVGLKHKAESKRKMRAAREFIQPWNKGRKTGPRSAESVAKGAAKLRGHKAWNAGQKTSDEHKAKIMAGWDKRRARLAAEKSQAVH